MERITLPINTGMSVKNFNLYAIRSGSRNLLYFFLILNFFFLGLGRGGLVGLWGIMGLGGLSNDIETSESPPPVSNHE